MSPAAAPLIALLLSAGFLSGCSPRPAPGIGQVSAMPTLAGYWDLVSFENWDSGGNRTTPFGEHPRGYVQYTPRGRMTLQVVRTPAPAPFAGGAEKGTVAEKTAAFDAYIAYFGTYTLDSARRTVMHHVEADINPSFTGSADPRPFRVTGDSLILGDERTWRRVFVRVPNE